MNKIYANNVVQTTQLETISHCDLVFLSLIYQSNCFADQSKYFSSWSNFHLQFIKINVWLIWIKFMWCKPPGWKLFLIVISFFITIYQDICLTDQSKSFLIVI